MTIEFPPNDKRSSFLFGYTYLYFCKGMIIIRFNNVFINKKEKSHAGLRGDCHYDKNMPCFISKVTVYKFDLRMRVKC